jgi:hypothetical protein
VAFLDIFGTGWRLQALHVAAIEAIPAAWENMFGIGPRLSSLSIGIVGGGTTYTVLHKLETCTEGSSHLYLA